jgi:hypothetical protein
VFLNLIVEEKVAIKRHNIFTVAHEIPIKAATWKNINN